MLKTVAKILSLIDKEQIKKIWFILFCIILMGVVEMMGVGTIVPFLAVITSPEAINNSTYLSMIYKFFDFSSDRTFMLFLGGMVFVVLVIGNIFTAFTTRLIICYCFNNGKEISYKIFEKYLSQPYIYFLNRHTSDLSKNILSEVDKLVTGVFMSILLSMSKLVMIIGIFSLLIAVDPILALGTLLILGSAYVLIYFSIRKKLTQAGQISAKQNSFRYRLVNEVLSAIKELKILNGEKTFLDFYNKSTIAYVNAESLNQLSPIISRYIIEVIAFGGMVLIALYLIGTQEDISKFMPLLGLYALAGYRLMPAMQQQFTSFAALRYNLASLNIVYNEMNLPILSVNHEVCASLNFEKALYLNNICFTYPNSNRTSLKNINVCIALNSTVGIVGSSGAGKTTLVDIILGLLTPSSGQLVVDNTIIEEKNFSAWQQNVGYVPQNISLMDTSVAQNIALGVMPEDIDMKAVIKASKLANLDDFIKNELPQGYETAIGEKGIRLSGGQRQRIGIARALYKDPKLLIFDEATSALDGATEKVVMEAIQNLSKQKTVVIIAHRLNSLRDCDVIYVLDKGQIVGDGNYSSLMKSNTTFQFLANV